MEWEYPWRIKESIRVDFFSRTLGNVSTLFHHGWEASMSIKYISNHVPCKGLYTLAGWTSANLTVQNRLVVKENF